MKNRMVFCASTIMLAVALFSCGNDKKPATQEASVAQAAKPVNESAGAASSQAGLHPTEQKFDAFMTDYINKIKAAFDEQDDAKSIALLQEINTEMTPRGEALKAEVEQWGKSMSESEKEAVKKRMEDKPYMKTLFDLASNSNFLQRLAKSQPLQDAYEKANEGFAKLEGDR